MLEGSCSRAAEDLIHCNHTPDRFLEESVCTLELLMVFSINIDHRAGAKWLERARGNRTVTVGCRGWGGGRR